MASRPRKPVSREATIPAPIGGWNARDPIQAIPPTDAVTLDNFIPGTGGVALRTGFVSHVTGIADPVHSLMEYSAATGVGGSASGGTGDTKCSGGNGVNGKSGGGGGGAGPSGNGGNASGSTGGANGGSPAGNGGTQGGAAAQNYGGGSAVAGTTSGQGWIKLTWA